MVVLAVGTDHESCRSDFAKATFLVKGDGARIELPNAEPKRVAPPLARLFDANGHELLRQPAALKGRSDVEALNFGRMIRRDGGSTAPRFSIA